MSLIPAMSSDDLHRFATLPHFQLCGNGPTILASILRQHADGVAVQDIAAAVGLSAFQVRYAIINGRLDLYTTELLMRQPDRAAVSDR